MKPYYDHAGTTIYHGDCRGVLATLDLSAVDVVLTDPPWGIQGGRGSNNIRRGKGQYLLTQWEDTPEYVEAVCASVVHQLVESVGRVIVTPGLRSMWLYPRPDDVGCFFTPCSRG